MQNPLFARIIHSRSFTVVFLALSVLAGMLFLYVAQPGFVRHLDAKAYDMLLPLAKRGHISPIPVIIDIDEPSLAKYGQWPWSRPLLARLIDTLSARGTAAIGLDILLAEPDRSSPRRLQSDVKRDMGLELTLGGMPEALMDYDSLFSEILRELPVVLGAFAQFGGELAADAPRPAGLKLFLHEQAGSRPFEQRLLSIPGALFPLPELWKSAPVAFLNMAPDVDGLVRRIPLLFALHKEVYPTLALRTLMLAMDTNSLVLGVAEDGLEYVRVANCTIPVSPEGNVLVPFQGKRKTYPYISAKDVLEGTVTHDALEGRIAFVGTSAAGLMDLRAMPFDRVYPGVEVHAALLDAMLSGQFIIVPSWTPGLQVLIILFCGAVAALAFGFARPFVYLPVAVVLLAGIVGAASALFLQGYFVSPLYGGITVITQGTALLFLRFWQEERQKMILRGAFSRYVSPEVVKRIAHLQGTIFAGEERELSILFTDIRGFTTVAEGLSPQQTVLLLNRYFTPMTTLVRDNNGTVDKFIGDALMAFWNAPLDVPEHPKLAVESAIAMQESLTLLNDGLEQDFGLRLTMGVGIHVGKAYVGNMGSADVMNYTLIGDAVNLASRLEGLCPKYGIGVVVSGATMKACNDAFVFQFLDTITVKGKSLPVDIYTPLRHHQANERKKELCAWHEARSFYVAGDFQRAATLCQQLHETHPENFLYTLYTERCQTLAANPPQQWTGIWALTSK